MRSVLAKPPVIESVDLLPYSVVQLYRENRFDLLGSGWRDWSLGDVRNPVNLANRRYARCLRRLISAKYLPLDWHVDPRAGHHWRARQWSRWIRPGNPAGVDIKLPWELSRMQHQLPLALSVLHDADRRNEQARQFRDQVLDFMAANPPRFGVNWRTPMDVAIRAANWVLCYSLYRAAGEVFDAEFEAVLSASLVDHGRHVVEYMEWDPVWRGNHYLANQCGLAIIAAALPSTSETDAWLAFAVQELNSEVLRQIRPDGGVFEASTGYHRLSVEMIVYATAVVLGTLEGDGLRRLGGATGGQVQFKKPLMVGALRLHSLPGRMEVRAPFTPEYFQRLAGAAAFVRDISAPDGRMPLIGDNDSGRFVRTRFSGDLLDWGRARASYTNLAEVPAVAHIPHCPVEDQRDVGYLLGCIAGLVEAPDLEVLAGPWQVESRLVRTLSGGLAARVALPSPPDTLVEHAAGPVPAEAPVLRIPLDKGVCDGLERKAYPDFGLYLFRSARLFLAVRCGPIGQDGFGGHAHNDQLSVALQVDGRDLIADPGVYRYTVDPAERRRYRSVQAHFAPRVADREPGDLSLGPWRLGDEAQARVEYFGEHGFQGSHRGFAAPIHRRVWFQAGDLCIADWGEDGLTLGDPARLYSQLNADGCLLPFCPGYGVQHA
jgi:hypothetical protein